jgi:ABC-2 type transport system ATP-binding protein
VTRRPTASLPTEGRRWVTSRRGWASRRWWASGRRRWAALLVLVLLLAGAGTALALRHTGRVRTSAQFVTGTPEPGGAAVRLDTDLYLPASTPAPAVLLAHGFGGSKADLAGQARSLARAGFVVLAYTARGFGASGGLIHLDSVHYEVADGSRLVDYLAARPEVAKVAGQPVVGVAGSSYGGALALMLGATDHRIAAVAADITWNNLARALFPNAGGNQFGVFKKLWAGYLFSSGFGAAPGSGADPAGGSVGAGCGRFAPQLCTLYQQAASGGPLDAALAGLLADSSPASVLDGMRAPTLLSQGEQDSLFGLAEADANARQLAQAGARVQVRWRAGGHDAPGAGDDVAGWQRQFFVDQLRRRASPSSAFLLSQPGAGISATNGRRVNSTLRAPSYPGLEPAGLQGGAGTAFTSTPVRLEGADQRISAPAGGTPAVVTSVPGLGQVIGAAQGLSLSGGAAASQLSRLPGQTAVFSSAPLGESTLIVGSSSVTLAVTAGRSGAVTLFAALHDLGPDGSDTLPAQLVSPVQLTGAPNQRHSVRVQLPWIVNRVPAGHRIALEVSSTDFSYALPSTPADYRIGLDGSELALSSLPVRQVRSGSVEGWLLTAAVVVLLCLAYGFWRLRAGRPAAPMSELSDVPIEVRELCKVYSDGYRAVDGVSFRVERGQVLGLLGPNGAGKTTTLRVLMGLILPTSGSVRVFGEQVVPGAAVLSRLGAFVEGPGFLPHLTGRENLRLFWAASGRPTELAELDTVLDIAGLGASLERRVRTYSHGMQQRLAIAQAMLGLPEVLILDEPTNGLDPPQIAEMRIVLARYAETGRTVIVSSHLLAEVEQTCTHLVVMHRGRLVAAGSVAEVAGAGASQLAVDQPERAVAVLAAAGIPARAVPARRALEDVFLDLIDEPR